MKPSEINALYEKATQPPWEAGHPLDPNVYAVRQPELECWIPQDIHDSRAIAALHNSWPAIYRELMAARALAEWGREHVMYAPQLDDLMRVYDAARRDTDNST